MSTERFVLRLFLAVVLLPFVPIIFSLFCMFALMNWILDGDSLGEGIGFAFMYATGPIRGVFE